MNLKSKLHKVEDMLEEKKLGKILSLLLLAIFFFLTIYYVRENLYYMLDSDQSSELILGRLLAKEGGILSKNWYYSTELRVLNTNLFYAFFFRFTDNWRHVRLLSYICMYIILLLTYFFMEKALGIKKYICLFAIILMLPFSVDYYVYVLQGGYYLPHLSIAFLTIALLAVFARKSGGAKYGIAFFSFVLAFLSGLGGPRQVFVLYFPLFLAAAGIYWFLKLKEEVYRNFLLIASCDFLGSILGYAINSKILSKIYCFKDYEINFTGFSFSELETMINGLLYDFGYSCESLFSFALIRNLLTAAWVLLTLYSIYYALKNVNKVSAEYVLLAVFTMAAYFVFILLYLFTDMEYRSRYWVLLVIFSIPLILFLLNEWELKKYMAGRLALLFLAVSCICGLAFYKEYWKTDKNNEIMQICSIVLNKGYDAGYGTFWNSNILTELSNGKLETYTWATDEDETTDVDLKTLYQTKTVDTIDEWLQLKEHKEKKPEGKVFLIFTTFQVENNNWKNNLKDEDLIYSSENYRVYGYESHETMTSILYEGVDISDGEEK